MSVGRISGQKVDGREFVSPYLRSKRYIRRTRLGVQTRQRIERGSDEASLHCRKSLGLEEVYWEWAVHLNGVGDGRGKIRNQL